MSDRMLGSLGDMSKKVRERFEELGELLDLLDECEKRPPQTRS